MYMNLAEKYAQQSPCKKRKVGCVIIKDDTVIAYGFNHGYEETCGCNPTTGIKNPHVLHAEAMALQGNCDSYTDADLWITYQPCPQCAELIIQKGIRAVYYRQPAKCNQSIQFLNQNEVSTHLL